MLLRHWVSIVPRFPAPANCAKRGIATGVQTRRSMHADRSLWYTGAMQRICVFCGSSPGRSPVYLEAAGELALALTRRGIALVYGGASVGVMGALADAVLAQGGEAIGVIPERLMEKERSHESLTELHVVESMHERKALMGGLSDAFIALPGGLGTLEEFFEVLTWNQLGIHSKPCGLFNAGGFFDALTSFLDHTVEEGFVSDAHRSFLLVNRAADSLLDDMQRSFARMKAAAAES